jgi:hypothetical protein
MRILLVHSPVIGPSTWRWVADALDSRGHTVVVPDLTHVASTGDPLEFARVAVRAGDPGEEVIVVGHSGAGSVLPAIAAGLPKARRTVFVDAGLPPCEGTFSAGGEFLESLRRLAVDGVLPVWSHWWGEGVMQTLVRDDDRRRAIEADLPQVPLAFFEASIAAPAGWCRSEGAYILLSDAYRSDATRAASFGWPVVERLGAHLDIANDEEAIADTLECFL